MWRKQGIQLSPLHCGLQPLSIENDSALYFLSSDFHKVQHCHSYLLFPCACLKHSYHFFVLVLPFEIMVVQLPSHVQLFMTPWTAALQTSLSLTISQSLPKFMSIPLVMPSSHLIFWGPLLLLPSILPTIRVFSSESAVCSRWPKHWSFSFSITPSNEYSGLISFKIDWFDLPAVQGTPKSLLQHHSSKASILQHFAFSKIQGSQLYMTTEKTIALTIRAFVSKMMSLFTEIIHSCNNWKIMIVIFKFKHIHSYTLFLLSYCQHQ